GSRRVLVVDDNLDTAESSSLLLEIEGHDVRVAHTGPEAIEIARSFAPDVILLDIGLPGMDGYAVARVLRAAPDLAHCRIIAVATPDKGFNRGGIFFKYNTGGKRSVALNLKDPRGLDLLRRLITRADVLTESFSSGALVRMGLPYEELRRLKPDLVYVSMSGLGHRG